MSDWIDACHIDDVDEDDVIRFDHAGETYAIIRSDSNTFHVIDGLCTHERVHLCQGLVMDGIIECPKHNGRFDYRTGKAKRAPVSVDLRTYETRVDNDRVQFRIT